MSNRPVAGGRIGMSGGEKMKVGMVGVRAFAVKRRQLMQESGLFDLVAVYNRTREPLDEFAAQTGIRPAYSYEELLDVPGLEAIVITSGASAHAEQTVKALDHGLHVFVEKPLCSSYEEIDTMRAAQQRSGKVVGVAHNHHGHDTISITIKNKIERGELGAIASFEKTTAHSGGLLIKPGDWRGDPTKNPGGMLFQCGVHAFHELMYYFGPIDEITATMRYDVHTTRTADVAVCLVKFRSGVLGTLNAYHVTPYRHTLNIYGTKAALYRDDRFHTEGTSLLMQTVPAALDGSVEQRIPAVLEGVKDESGNMRSFYKAVREGGTPYPSLNDGARAVAAVLAAEESARTQRPVKVNPYA